MNEAVNAFSVKRVSIASVRRSRFLGECWAGLCELYHPCFTPLLSRERM